MRQQETELIGQFKPGLSKDKDNQWKMNSICPACSNKNSIYFTEEDFFPEGIFPRNDLEHSSTRDICVGCGLEYDIEYDIKLTNFSFIPSLRGDEVNK